MNKQAFISGQIFKLSENAFTAYQLESSSDDRMSIVEMGIKKTGSVADWSKTHVCNVEFVGTKKFRGYTYVMGKRVNVMFDYSDLIPFTPTEVV